MLFTQDNTELGTGVAFQGSLVYPLTGEVGKNVTETLPRTWQWLVMANSLPK